MSVMLGDHHSTTNAPPLTDEERRIVDEFHKIYYKSLHFVPGQERAAWLANRNSWLGYPILKCPFDLFIYQEILLDTKPDVIIETGTFRGGSALFLATMCQLMGRGRVVTVDLRPIPGVAMPNHPLIEYRHGYSQSPNLVASIKQTIKSSERTMVILDSDHRKDHVMKEMAVYAPLVAVGCYMIVEDSNFNGHPVHPNFGPGPMEAIHEFCSATDDFTIDRSRERHLVTFNPSGFLLRVNQTSPAQS